MSASTCLLDIADSWTISANENSLSELKGSHGITEGEGGAAGLPRS